MTTLPFKSDRFRGGVIDCSSLTPAELSSFKTSLPKTVLSLRESGDVRGLWIHIDACEKGHLEVIPIAFECGFRVHHSTEKMLAMLNWLPENEPCGVPGFAHTYIGCGAVCMDSHGRIACIRERWGPYRDWKLPGGHVDITEDIFRAANRELTEETGISHADPLALVSFRAQHAFAFGQDDMYFGVLFHAPDVEEKCNGASSLSSVREAENIEINEEIAREIAEARWIPLNELVTLDALKKNHVARETIRSAVKAVQGEGYFTAENFPEFRAGTRPQFYRVCTKPLFEDVPALQWVKDVDIDGLLGPMPPVPPHEEVPEGSSKRKADEQLVSDKEKK